MTMTRYNKGEFAYEWPRGSPWTPYLSRHCTRRWTQRQEMRRLSALPCAEVTVSAQRVGLFRGMFCESGARVFRHVLSSTSTMHQTIGLFRLLKWAARAVSCQR